jgi:hypothetical protein
MSLCNSSWIWNCNSFFTVLGLSFLILDEVIMTLLSHRSKWVNTWKCTGVQCEEVLDFVISVIEVDYALKLTRKWPPFLSKLDPKKIKDLWASKGEEKMYQWWKEMTALFCVLYLFLSSLLSGNFKSHHFFSDMFIDPQFLHLTNT